MAVRAAGFYDNVLRNLTGEGNEIIYRFLYFLLPSLFIVAILMMAVFALRSTRFPIANHQERKIAAASPIAETATPVSPVKSAPQRKIAYRTVRKWSIANGGFGSDIVIDPANRNEADLRSLGEALKYESREDRNAVVTIFDDVKAAAMAEHSDNLDGEDDRFYAKHLVGAYLKNANTAFHALKIMLNGVDGSEIVVSY
jgi:hypothetical protein